MSKKGNPVKRIILTVSIVTTLGLAAASPAFAGTSNPPTNSGSNATAFGYGFTSSDFHDIDRKNCNVLGCDWLDGSNVNYSSSGTGTVYRGKTCGTHTYRHQSSDGSKAQNDLTYNC